MLLLWQGLGYYKRAENMHKAAKLLYDKKEDLPKVYSELCRLPGIGDYIASAICAIAYDQKITVIDGNVLRVLSRLFMIEADISDPKSKKLFKNILQEILPEQDNRYFAQALMELGALICRSKSPDCDHCPLKRQCKACSQQKTEDFPINQKQLIRKSHLKHFWLIKIFGHYCLEKRDEKGLLSNLWQFIELPPDQLDHYLKHHRLKTLHQRKICEFKHQFTHQEWQIEAFQLDCVYNGQYRNWGNLQVKRKRIRRLKSFSFLNTKLFQLSGIHQIPVHKSMLKIIAYL